jgi:hypothetical protein
MIPLQRTPLDDALHRLGHIQPGARIGRREEQDTMLSTPLGQAWTLVPCEIIPDQQHSDRREKAVQLLCCGVDVPILPASSFGNDRGGWWALSQDCSELLFEPGMQDGIGGALHRLGSQFPGGRAKQGQ